MEQQTPRKDLYPMDGLHLWKNERNGFLVFELKYTADPLKRDPNYIKEIKEAMPTRQFKQEYELQWDSFSGLPVFADWSLEVHGVKSNITPQLGSPLLLGFDWGLTPACIVGQMQEDTLCVLVEYTAVHMGAERFVNWVVPQLKTRFHQWQSAANDYLVFVDPAGFQRAQSDESTCVQVIEKAGFKNIIPGAIAWEERRLAVESFLTRRTRNGPCFRVSLPNCPILVRGFQGGYRYDDGVLEREPSKLRPYKNQFSHIHDATQMIASRVLMTKPAIIQDIPRQSYMWNNDSDNNESGLYL